MDGDEVVAVHLGAHLDADVVRIVDVPGRCVADHLAVGGLHDLRALPEGLRQRLEAERRVEGLALADHARRVVLLGDEQVADVVAQVARALGRDEIVDVAPFLRPHVAEQVGTDRAGLGLHGVAVLIVQLPADVRVEREVERLHLLPDLVGGRGELVGRHVVARAPHRADIGIAEALGTLVGERRHLLVIGPHRRADIVVPARPHLLQLGGVAGRAHRGLDVGAVDRLAVERAAALAVGRGHLGGERRQLVRRARPGGRGQHDAAAQQVELALGVVGQVAGARVAGGLVRQLHLQLGQLRVRRGSERVGVVGDVGGVDPVYLVVRLRRGGELPFGIGDEGGRLRRGRRGGGGTALCGRGGGAEEARQNGERGGGTDHG